MLEEIKKELLKLNIHECDIEDVFEILDKHNFKSKLDTLNKGIDELIKKYIRRYDPKEFYLDVENTMICEFIKELKKLKEGKE